MTHDYYTDNSAISKSGLDAIEISPLDYWWRYMNPLREGYKEDKDTAFDKALRSAIMDPKDFAARYVKKPPVVSQSQTAKSERAALERTAAQRGQVLILSSEFDLIQEMKKAVFNHKTTKLLFETGAPGKDTRFTEPISDCAIKFRPHWITGTPEDDKRIIVNLTSAKDATSEEFSKEAWNKKHHKRAAIQMDATGFPVVFVVIEKQAPFKIGIHHLDERSLLLGRDTYIDNCQTYMQCLESNKWPGLSEKIEPVSLPEYAFKR